MPKRTYLRSPTDDYEPDKNIQLGHVWRNPRDPGSFIDEPLPIPKNIPINHVPKGTWKINLGRESHGNLGLWAKLAQLPITNNARIHWDEVEDGSYKVPTMDTYSIEPTTAYVEASVASVSAEILKSGDNLYMVTGVKIARGGEGSNKESKNVGVENETGVDLTTSGAPVEVGTQVSYSKGAHNNQEFGSTGDFVFAYRVREVFYKRGVLKTKEYNKGAVLGEGMTPVGTEEEGPEIYVIEDAEVGDGDYEADGECYSFIDDDGEESEIVI